MKNPEIKNAFVGLAISFMGLLMFLFPMASDMDGMNGGYALMFMAIALVIPAGVITAVLYGVRAMTLQKIVSGKDLIAHWTYSPEEWNKYTEEEYVREKSAKMGLFYILVFFCVLIGGGLFILAEDKEAAGIVLAGLFCLVVFIRLLIAYATRNTYDANKKYLGEAYIGKSGVYLNKSFHSWNFLSQLEGASIDSKNMILEITYSVLSNQGKNYESVRIPIPSGKEEEARKVVSSLGAGR